MKIAIFIDGGYLNKVLENEFKARIDFSKLPHAVSRGKEILRTYYYNCLPYQGSPPSDEEKERFSKAQKFFKFLDRLERYEVRTGTLVRRGSEFQQKGIDTLLSIDLVNFAALGKISDAVLVTGDYDFIPAVKVAKNHGVNIILYHSQLTDCYHTSLWEVCDERIPITQAFVDSIKWISPTRP